jgi:hypothetical protein
MTGVEALTLVVALLGTAGAWVAVAVAKRLEDEIGYMRGEVVSAQDAARAAEDAAGHACAASTECEETLSAVGDQITRALAELPKRRGKRAKAEVTS